MNLKGGIRGLFQDTVHKFAWSDKEKTTVQQIFKPSTQVRSGQGQGYITTNNQSVSMSWYRAQSRTIDQSLLSP
jgi:hypothetical protein